MMVAQRERLRMAAVLFARLDRNEADALLARMSPAEARKIRQAVVELSDVDADEEEAALEALTRGRTSTGNRRASASFAIDGAGIDLDDRLARRLAATVRDEATFGDALASPATASQTDFDESPQDETPFRFLHEARMDELAERLGREHPQAIAVVLAYLPAARAAEALAALAEPVQVEVVRRLAVMEPTDAVVVREIEDALRRWIAPAVESGSPSVGMTAAQRILSAATGSTQRHVLEALAHRDAALARRLGHVDASPSRSPAGVDHRTSPAATKPASAATPHFSELEPLAPSQLAALWRGIDLDVAVLSLAAATPAFVDRVLDALDESLANTLCRELDALGPVSLADLDAAQEAVVAAWGAMQQCAAGGVAA